MPASYACDKLHIRHLLSSVLQDDRYPALNYLPSEQPCNKSKKGDKAHDVTLGKFKHEDETLLVHRSCDSLAF